MTDTPRYTKAELMTMIACNDSSESRLAAAEALWALSAREAYEQAQITHMAVLDVLESKLCGAK